MNFSTYDILILFFVVFVIRHLSNLNKRKNHLVPLPPTAVIVCAYLENEAKIIEKSLCSYLQVKGITSIHLVWNGPTPSDPLLLARIRNLKNPENNLQVSIHEIKNSTSKAENLNFIIPRITEAYLLICDADDILYPNALDEFFSQMSEEVLCVQGLYKIRDSGNKLVWAADVVEQITLCCLTSIVCDFVNFRGHNGLWQKRALVAEKFDQNALTEDFEMSIRIHKYGVIKMVGITGEISSPPSFRSYLTQRARWYHGGLLQANTSYGLIFSLWFVFLFYCLYKTWWSTLLITYLLTSDLKTSFVAFTGLYIYILSLPCHLPLLIKRLVFKDTKFNVTPRRRR